MKKTVLIILFFIPVLLYGQGIRIQDFPAASTLGGTEVFPGNQGSATKKISIKCITKVIKMTVRTPVQDFVNTDDTPDFPIEWADALHYALAVRLLSVYDVPTKIAQYVIQMAGVTLADADGFDREQNVSAYFTPSEY